MPPIVSTRINPAAIAPVYDPTYDRLNEAVAGSLTRYDRRKAQERMSAEAATERTFREKMQGQGFAHDRAMQGERLSFEGGQADLNRSFQEESQRRLFGHEDTARRETFDFQGTQNAMARDLQDQISRRGEATQRYGIDRNYDLGNRRLGIDAIEVGARVQGYGPNGRGASGEISPATVASIVNSAASNRSLLPEEVLPVARERVDSIMSWTNRGRMGGAPSGFTPPSFRFPPTVAPGAPRGAARLEAPPATAEAAARDSVAEQQGHWDAAAAALKKRGVKDVEGEIGPRPGGRS